MTNLLKKAKIRTKYFLENLAEFFDMRVLPRFYPVYEWLVDFKSIHPVRFYVCIFTASLICMTLFFRTFIIERLLIRAFGASSAEAAEEINKIEGQSIESFILTSGQVDIAGAGASRDARATLSTIGYVDVRALALEDFFEFYGSPLADFAAEFIEACEKYNVDNWQLIPAIAINETNGCQTGISYKQKNCWGWGGVGENRIVFDSFEQAIDRVTYHMITKYGNDRLNAKDIQATYCGPWCRDWEWAKGVNYYVFRINDQGEKYGLRRTHEIRDFSD